MQLIELMPSFYYRFLICMHSKVYVYAIGLKTDYFVDFFGSCGNDLLTVTNFPFELSILARM
jgi:hypothetical protein